MSEGRRHEINLLPRDGFATLYDSLFDAACSARYFTLLRETLDWQTEAIRMFNKRVLCPRLVSWYGAAGLTYRYSGNTHRAGGWPAALLPIREAVAGVLQQDFNFVLCNHYRDGDDYMGWHDDGERELGADPLIASVSFGAVRPFELQHKTMPLKRSMPLESGSLLVMSGATQRYWKHRLPKQRSQREGRINLSFRQLKDTPCATKGQRPADEKPKP